ncbi:hypothetical protein [Eisenibacter elegans]|uniref:hypothetical protein n=1 Tax=Eisenibacter elegans TaxID=997 RepID=UPI0003FE3C54|nr:hypothetical protein [Eisenibacter elegans]
MNRFCRFFALFILLICANYTQGYAQAADATFGKNRVQHKRFYWSYYKTDNFDIYFYDGGARMANLAARYLETEFDRLTNALGYLPSRKAKIFIYNSVDELQQSNIGLGREALQVGGQTNFINAQAEIPYTGSEISFKKELLYGVSYMFVTEMLYGGNIKDLLQNTYGGEFSDWFIGGAAAYVAFGWNEEMDDKIRSLVISKKLKRPNLLTGEDAVIAGQSIWNFIAEKYGKNNLSNVLNLARILRNEKKSIASTFGGSYRGFIRDWEKYYEEVTRLTNEQTEDPEYDYKVRNRNRKVLKYNTLAISPEGDKLAYSENKQGRYKIFVRNLAQKPAKKKKLFRTGYYAVYQRFDENVPQLSWKSNQELGVMHFDKGKPKLTVLNMRKKTTFDRSWASLGQVHSYSFSDDGNFLVMSADRQGQSNYKTAETDIFIYDFELDYVDQLTSDWEDDLYPRFLKGSNDWIVFSSNRREDTLRTNLFNDRGPFDRFDDQYDLFLYNITKKTGVVNRLTDGTGSKRMALPVDQERMLYISDETGITQLYLYNFNSGDVQLLTNYKQSIMSYDFDLNTQSLVYTLLFKGQPIPVVKQVLDLSANLAPFKTPRADMLASRFSKNNTDKGQKTIIDGLTERDKAPEEDPYEPDEVDTDNYVFNIEKDGRDKDLKGKTAQSTILNRAKKARSGDIRVIGAYEYEPRFRTEGLTTSFLFDPLRGFGALLNFSTADILENHRIRAGLLMISDLRSSSFYVDYLRLGRRFDYIARFDRDVIFLNSPPLLQRYAKNTFSFGISYPFTNLSRIEVGPFFVNTTFTELNPNLLAVPNSVLNFAGYKAEYVYDNTIINGMNMIYGTRAKANFYSFNALGDAPESFYRFSADIRNYTRVHRDLMLATRVVYGHFGGNSPKRYLLGGMDNWFGQQTDNTGNDDALQTEPGLNNPNLLFVEFITNMRGFNYNKFSGTNVLLTNVELRFPIIRYLFGKRITSKILSNLQLVGFTDAGTAWTEGNPFTPENNVSTRNIGAPGTPFFATVNNFKSPFLIGYGFGARTILLGYYLKLDVAWGVEDFVPAERPKFYVTFGYDF